jgi:GDP-L-fucose synthase
MSFYEKRLALVTGGTGFVGSHIVEALLAAGARVRVPMHERPLRIDHPGIEKVSADLTRREECIAAMRGVDFVFHAAGAVSAAGVTINSPMRPITDNLILTAMVVEAAWTVGIERLLLFSSSTAYPVTEHPVREDELWTAEPHPTYFGYGWMRRYFEKMGAFLAQRSKVKVALVRPSAVYGPHDDFDPKSSHVVPALILKAVNRMDPYEVWGTGDEVRDFLHVEDLVRGCLLLLEKHPTSDPVNIAAGTTHTVRDIVNFILDAAGHRPAKLNFDASKPTTIPKRMVDVEKARRLLGFQPRLSLQEGLRQTVRWYLDQRG